MGAVEANPFFASLLAGVGPTAAYVTKLVAVSIVAALAYRSGRLRLLRWLSLAMVCIVICNVVVLS